MSRLVDYFFVCHLGKALNDPALPFPKTVFAAEVAQRYPPQDKVRRGALAAVD
jgi:hypothetical protein